MPYYPIWSSQEKSCFPQFSPVCWKQPTWILVLVRWTGHCRNILAAQPVVPPAGAVLSPPVCPSKWALIFINNSICYFLVTSGSSVQLYFAVWGYKTTGREGSLYLKSRHVRARSHCIAIRGVWRTTQLVQTLISNLPSPLGTYLLFIEGT